MAGLFHLITITISDAAGQQLLSCWCNNYSDRRPLPPLISLSCDYYCYHIKCSTVPVKITIPSRTKMAPVIVIHHYLGRPRPQVWGFHYCCSVVEKAVQRDSPGAGSHASETPGLSTDSTRHRT